MAATVVVGTAGHIDHGKTTLLRALTGIDADRLPEERARGMTIDVGFAHRSLEDGSAIDFVDVPGHDRLVGNMLVGAGEIDAVLLVVAADDGPRAQTLEHLALLDALGLRHAVVAITKVDTVEPTRVAEVEGLVSALVRRTGMSGAPIVAVSGTTGTGIDALRAGLVALRAAVLAELEGPPAGPIRLAIDRTFTVRGRGTVVTGTLRGGSLRPGAELRLEPSGGRPSGGRPSSGRQVARVREIQVHHGPADRADGGRTALNLAGIDAEALRRGGVLTAGAGIVASDRLLVALRRPTSVSDEAQPTDARSAETWPPAGRPELRLHHWTDSVDARIGPVGATWPALDAGDRGQALTAIGRLAQPVATMVGARAVLRDPGSGRVVAGVTVLDPRPPRGVSRRRATPTRLRALATAVGAIEASGAVPLEGPDASAALLDLHGLRGGELAPDVTRALGAAATVKVGDGIGIAELRAHLGRELRRLVSVERGAAPSATAALDRFVSGLVAAGTLVRAGDRVMDPARRSTGDAALEASMARLESLLDVNVPPSLAEAARAAACPPDGIRRLETAGRIVRVEDDLAWAEARYAALRSLVVELARRGPVAPAAFRDAIGGNRRVSLALLEDLGRRGVLRRTEAGHVLGPRA